ncbi:hypothetical protein P171DRAFT_429523 [Karstenula rhodostoma CBS 690.94]|uniref:RNase III domain-containing protein n=1 Tax=Karstenula rhodostoma CBS 690.94 TaxID=1392251 RepID=A0A9P4PRA8_9PLEO|nr:hypothetical protein P171DRAFT_429523 [Karstenula rhodostoma CBS 690.94]
MGRLFPRSAFRPVLSLQDKKILSKFETQAKTLKATRGRSLSDREKRQLEWLVRAQECIRAGLLTVAQVKNLRPYRKLTPTAQFQQLEKDHTKIRRHLELLQGHTLDRDDHGKSQSILDASYHQLGLALETQQAQPEIPLQQANSLPSQPPGAVAASISSPVERPLDPETRPQPTPLQHSGDSKPFWRVWGLKNATKSRILSAQERLFRIFWGGSPSQQGIFPGRNEHAHRLSNFFTRRDTLFFHMSLHPLRFYRPPPTMHLDLFNAATRVARIEEILGYRFGNKMLCLEALKGSRLDIPLYWQGVVTPVADNQRLALIGDRVLGLAVTSMWWNTNLPPSAYHDVRVKLESRTSLALRATQLGIDDMLFIGYAPKSVVHHVAAETLEAIIGAVYVDSYNSLSVVQGVLKKLRFEHDLHQLAEALKPRLATSMAELPASASAPSPSVELTTDSATNLASASASDSTSASSPSPAPSSAIKLTTNSATDSARIDPAVLPEEDLPAAPSSEGVCAVRGLPQSEQIAQLFRLRLNYERWLAGNHRYEVAHRNRRHLDEIKLQLKDLGVATAEYEAYRHDRLIQEKGFASQYNRLQCHMVELRELLNSENLSLQRHRVIEQRLRLVRHRAAYIGPSADFDGITGDENVKIGEGIVASDDPASIEDAYLLHEATIGRIAFSEISTLMTQAASRSIAIEDAVCDLLEEHHNHWVLIYNTKSQLDLAQSQQTIRDLKRKQQRLERRITKSFVQFPSLKAEASRGAWRALLELAFKNDPQRLQRIVKLWKSLTPLSHDHSRELSDDEQCKEDEGNEKTAREELDMEKPQEQKTAIEAHCEDQEIQESNDELSCRDTLEKVEQQQEQQREDEAKDGAAGAGSQEITMPEAELIEHGLEAEKTEGGAEENGVRAERLMTWISRDHIHIQFYFHKANQGHQLPSKPTLLDYLNAKGLALNLTKEDEFNIKRFLAWVDVQISLIKLRPDMHKISGTYLNRLKTKGLIRSDVKFLPWHELYKEACRNEKPVQVITMLENNLLVSESKSERNSTKDTQEDTQQDVEDAVTNMEPVTTKTPVWHPTEFIDRVLPRLAQAREASHLTKTPDQDSSSYVLWKTSQQHELFLVRHEAQRVGDMDPDTTLLGVLKAKKLVHEDLPHIPWRYLHRQAEQGESILALLGRLPFLSRASQSAEVILGHWIAIQRKNLTTGLNFDPSPTKAKLMWKLQAKGLVHPDVTGMPWERLLHQIGNENLFEYLKKHPLTPSTFPPIENTTSPKDDSVKETSRPETVDAGFATSKEQIPKESTDEQPKNERLDTLPVIGWTCEYPGLVPEKREPPPRKPTPSFHSRNLPFRTDEEVVPRSARAGDRRTETRGSIHGDRGAGSRGSIPPILNPRPIQIPRPIQVPRTIQVPHSRHRPPGTKRLEPTHRRFTQSDEEDRSPTKVRQVFGRTRKGTSSSGDRSWRWK